MREDDPIMEKIMDATTGLDRESLFAHIRETLTGACLSTAGQLRHMADRSGFSFVSVEVVDARETQVHMLLRPKDLGEEHVFAERSQHRRPFLIRSVARGAPA